MVVPPLLLISPPVQMYCEPPEVKRMLATAARAQFTAAFVPPHAALTTQVALYEQKALEPASCSRSLASKAPSGPYLGARKRWPSTATSSTRIDGRRVTPAGTTSCS